MPKKRHRCTQCNEYDHLVGPISRSGLCPICAKANYESAQRQLKEKHGPVFNKYKRNSDLGNAAYRDSVKGQMHSAKPNRINDTNIL